MNLNEAINKLRLQKGLSDEEIAYKLGLNKSSVFRLRKGKNKHTSPSTARKIADLIDCDFIEENKELIFTPKTNATPESKILPPEELIELDKVVSEFSDELGYKPTAEGLRLFLRECRGQYRKINTIRELLTNQKNIEGQESIRK
jgi:transcriptional regulator with XRE-family HTH domain